MPSVEPVLTTLSGFGFGLSLIVAIGAQNAFVLRQGLRREHVLAVAAIGAVSDAVLYAAGVGGLGSLLQRVPGLIDAVRWLGAAVLVGYGVLALRRAVRGGGELDAAPGEDGRRLRPVVLTMLALTWLNPHVYLDTVILLGSIAATHGEQRWLFGAGAMVSSVVWFFGLAYGARLLAPWLARPGAWRVLDAVVGVIVLAVAASLVLGA